MWNWLKKKFSRKEEQVMAVRQAARPKIMPPPPPRRSMRGDTTISDIRIGDQPIEQFDGFRFSNPSPVFSFDSERMPVAPLPQDRVETPKYEPAPAREPVANFTYTEPASSYESSSSCDSSSYSSSDSGSSCSSD